MKKIILGSEGMTLEDLVAIARRQAGVRLAEPSGTKIRQARALVEDWVREGRVVYGVTTGFGALSDVVISREDTRTLQKNLIMSHAAGVGPVLEIEAVRAVMALRIKDFARGNSGIRIETVELLTELLNRGVTPVVPEKGSVGASGDLAPLAHLALVLIGLGEALYKEDHVSMGTIAARKSREVVRNAEHVLAIELLCAAQALDLFTNMKPGEGTLAAYRIIRKAVPHLEKDRVLSPDIESVVGLIRNGLLLDAVEKTVGPLY